MKRVLCVLLLVCLSSLSAFSQRKFLPKGKWLSSNEFITTKLGAHIEMWIAKDTLVFNIIDPAKQISSKKYTYLILKVSADKQKGKLLFKEVDGDKYGIGFFYKFTAQDIIMTPSDARFPDLQKAEKAFEDPKEWLIKIMNQARAVGEKEIKEVDPYKFGTIFRTIKRIEALKKMPAIPNNKKILLTVIDKIILTFKNLENTKKSLGPIEAIYILTRVMEKEGYNPIVSTAQMFNYLTNYEQDKDAMSKLVDFKKYVLSRFMK